MIAELYPGLRALGPIKAWLVGVPRQDRRDTAQAPARRRPLIVLTEQCRTCVIGGMKTPSRRGAVEASDRLANALIDIAALGC